MERDHPGELSAPSPRRRRPTHRSPSSSRRANPTTICFGCLRLTLYLSREFILFLGVLMKIGAAAARAGVNVQTLRYYARRGLLPRLQRRPSGYREFSDDAVRIVRFVKRAQDLGFTLDEVEKLLRLRHDKYR